MGDDILIYLMLFVTGVLAGVSNAIAGGGTFFTFPAFLAAGVPPVMANASNAVAVWPGHALALVGYRRELGTLSNQVKGSLGVALVGGIAGALLLASFGNESFSLLIPWLILAATLLMIFGPSLNRALAKHGSELDYRKPGLRSRGLEFVFSVYGGFFGAGLGIMFMAGLQILGIRDAQLANALKNLLATVVTSVAVLVLAVSGLVSWSATAFAFAGAVVGGLVGGHVASRMPSALLRRLVIGLGLLLTLYYLVKYYLW